MGNRLERSYNCDEYIRKTSATEIYSAKGLHDCVIDKNSDNCKPEWPVLSRRAMVETVKEQECKDKQTKQDEQKIVSDGKHDSHNVLRKKKWRRVKPSDIGFNLSIIPFIVSKRRGVCDDGTDFEELEKMCDSSENNFENNYPLDHEKNDKNNNNEKFTSKTEPCVGNSAQHDSADKSKPPATNQPNADLVGGKAYLKNGYTEKRRKKRARKRMEIKDDSDLYEERLVESDFCKLLKFEGTGNLRIRQKRKWRCEKAHKQIKTKYCASVHNGGHRKSLFVKHRIAKNMVMCLGGYTYKCIAGLSIKAIDKSKGFKGNARPMPFAHYGFSKPATSYPVAQVMPSYAMTAYNADDAIAPSAANTLMNLQYRDLTPEDYELLLLLDDRVKPKTVSQPELDSLPTREILEGDENTINSGVCSVCMEHYSVGQKQRSLPCGHAFHLTCIDMWLTNSSVNCPLDGSEVFPS